MMKNQVLQDLCTKAAALLQAQSRSTRIRVVSHYDADGIAAAGVLCATLYNHGYDFHATLMRNPFTKGFDRLHQEHNELIIFSDMGSAQIHTIESLHCPAIILDHHQPIKKDTADQIIQINANLCGYDGNYDISGATLAYALAAELGEPTEQITALALAGATGDKQYLGGYRGYNKEILDHATHHKLLQETIGLKLPGDSLTDALYYSIDPYYKGLSGDKHAIETTLKNLHIDGNHSIENLNDQEKTRLHSYLILTLLKAGCQPLIINEAIRTRYHSPSLRCELERFADLLDACGKNGHRSLGLALCLGNTNAYEEAKKVEHDYKEKILTALHQLEEEGPQEMNALRYFTSTDSSLGGVIGGIAMNYLFDEKKPLFSLARKNNEIHVSCRGNQLLVENGLDLGYAMKTVAEKLGGHGGGHKIASGATIAADKEQEFLKQTDLILQTQLKGK
ncbi:MAG: DHH family phosphoesterase [Methanobacteriota archaeon]